MKTFRLLALPDDHPFWSAEAAPLPAAYTAPGLTLQPAAHLLLQRRPNGGVNLYAPAEVEKNDHGQFAEKYGKFCYSTRFGFSASRSYAQLAQAAPDSMLAFEIGGQIFVRRHSLRFEVRPDSLFSVWSPSPALRSKPRSAPPQPDISAGTKSTARSPAPPGTAALRCRAMRRVIPPRQKTARPRRPTQRWAAPCAATERPKCSTPGPIPISMTPTAPFPPGVMQSMPATASGIAKL